MATQYVFGTLTGPGTLINLGDLDSAVVGATGNVGATTESGITGTGSAQRVHVAGTVAADAVAVWLGNDSSADFSNTVTIAATGMINSVGNAAVLVFGSGSNVVNAGAVHGHFGVFASGDGGGTGQCVNTGTISGVYGVLTSGTDSYQLVSTGTISGQLYSFADVGGGDTTIINRGPMIGDVSMFSGNDRYDGRLGTVIGTVFGESGNDTFVPGSDIDVFDGGSGIDTLDLRMTQGIRVVLGGDQSTGVAQGDTYTGIENIYGSLTGRDLLIGDGANNTFITNGGDDVANMGAGNDVFLGADGKDMVWGGAGNDAFVFITPSQGGDLIQDFTNLVGNNDHFRIKALGFGGGLTTGLLAANQFQVRADNLAQDADDRFIFRTTDNTLWYDSNGSAAGGLSMIADLQAGAMLSAADILIY